MSDLTHNQEISNLISKPFPTFGMDKKLLLPQMLIAEKSAKLLFNGGVNIRHENDTADKRLKEILEYNKIEEFLKTNEKYLSAFGNTFATIDIVEGMPTLSLCEPTWYSRIGKFFMTDLMAVVWKRIAVDNMTLPIKEVWTRTNVKRYFFNANNTSLTVEQFNEKVPANLQVAEEWEHNLGFIPVVMFKNKSAFRGWSNPDTAWVSKHLTDYKCAFDILERELEKNQTRILGKLNKKFAKALKQEMKSKNKSFGAVVEDYLLNVEVEGDKSGDGAKNLLQVIQGNPKINEYWTHIYNLKSEMFNGSGYSMSRATKEDSIGGQGETATLFANKEDIETTREKLAQRTPELRELIQKIQGVDSKWGYGSIYGDFANTTCEIKSKMLIDTISEEEKAEVSISTMTMSRVEHIMKRDGLSKPEAELKFKEILAEAELVSGLDSDNNDDDNSKE